MHVIGKECFKKEILDLGRETAGQQPRNNAIYMEPLTILARSLGKKTRSRFKIHAELVFVGYACLEGATSFVCRLLHDIGHFSEVVVAPRSWSCVLGDDERKTIPSKEGSNALGKQEDRANESHETCYKATTKGAAKATAENAEAESEKRWPTRDVEQAEARQTKQKLAPQKGAVSTTHESRHIPVLHATLVSKGVCSSAAMKEVCDTFCVGIYKVSSVVNTWREASELKQGSSEGRGVAKDPDNDKRRLSSEVGDI